MTGASFRVSSRSLPDGSNISPFMPTSPTTGKPPNASRSGASRPPSPAFPIASGSGISWTPRLPRLGPPITSRSFHLNLDRFKSVNNTLGVSAGDEILRQVADRLRALASDKSNILARLGSDEFAILQNGRDSRGT